MHLRSVCAVLLSSTVLLLANAPARAENVQSASGNPESCQERVNDQNFKEVIAGCTAIIDGGNASRSDLGRAHYIRGRGYGRADEDLKAAEDFRTVLTLMPETDKYHREALNSIASMASVTADGCVQPPFDELKPELVIPACSRAIDAKHLYKDFELASLYFRRGRAYSKSGQLTLALEDYDNVLLLEPEWTDALSNRGAILRKQEKFEQAIATFDKAIEIDPDHWRALFNRGSTHEANQDYAKAVADYRAVVQLLKPSDFTKDLEEKIAKFETDLAGVGRKPAGAPQGELSAEAKDRLQKLQADKKRTQALLARQMISSTEADAIIAGIDQEIARLTGTSGPTSTAQAKPEPAAKPAALPAGEHRVALVMGNSAYVNTTALPNPKNDARLIAKSLEAVGFEVTLVIDADQAAMKQAMLEFGRALRKNATTGLFYYAGHGVQVHGKNYLIPVNATIAAEDEIDLEGIDVNDFLQLMNRSKSRVNIVVLDACRNNPFARSFRSAGGGAGDGLAPVRAPRGTYIAYATGPGQVAVDGDGDNSPYTQALSRAITEPGLSLETVFKRTRSSVLEATDEQQVPWETSSITGEFYFRPGN